ncbi:uncharacterized protein [Drosophila kikkawai]|uniref:Uncharacterized protein n=1 Tax=Drosophila kikkawai TaxID=30033 RepID=A0A6P4ID81_DROKI|nr:uncharacterized protein LOC108074237 [Drosophila kikkawai]KAH8338180.1 hypothetical protein KR059_011187 [Drosophila kikkawai]
MTPFDDFVYLINHVLLGEEPTIEDFILLVGTLVAFIAFILWCCFPIQPKEPGPHRQFTCKIIQNPIKAFDASTSTDDPPAHGAGTAAGGSSSSSSNNLQYNGNSSGSSGSSGSGSGSYSKNGTVAMHNYYVKNGHHCCT